MSSKTGMGKLSSQDDAASALWALDPAVNRQTWVRILTGAKAAGLDFNTVRDWSMQASNYDEAGMRNTWNSLHADGGISPRTLFWMARDVGWQVGTEQVVRPVGAIREPEFRRTPAWLAEIAWAECEAATAEHPYIKRKGGTPEGLRIYPTSAPPRIVAGEDMRGWLVVPAYGHGGALSTLQFISPELGGRKLNLPGHSVAGGFTLGSLNPGAAVYVCEGIGAAWAAHQAAGDAALVAFGAGNQRKVADAVKSSGSRPVIISDRGKESACMRAAQEIGCTWVGMPEHLGDNEDLDDLKHSEGMDAVRAVLERERGSPTAISMKVKLASSDFDAPGAANDQVRRPQSGPEAVAIMAGYGVTLSGNKNHEPYSNLDNAVAVLKGHPRFTRRIWYDKFRQEVMTTWEGGEPRPWADWDRLLVTTILQRDFGLARFSDELVGKAALTVAQADQRDQLQDWLTSRRWDGKKRLGNWMHHAIGAPNDSYHVAVGRNFILSMAARGLRPGCKVDTMPVFEGAQGAGKSRLLSILGGDFYTELSESLDTKDFFIAIQGKWLVEIAELDAFRRSDVTRIKQVLSSTCDRCRLPYARSAVDLPRRAVFAGTTNETEYLRDPTGARRFWPVKVGHINHKWLADSRDYLFAEAVEQLHANATWWEVPVEEARRQAEERRETDPWEDAVAECCDGRSEVIVSDVLSNLGVDTAKQTKSEQMRVSRILVALGLERQQLRRNNRNVRGWVKRADTEQPF